MRGLPAALQVARERPGRAALLLDYDGTLAPIVPDPSSAAPWPGVPDLLTRLGRRFGRVAVISGRPGAFLAAMLGAPAGVDLIGLYGMERVDAGGEVRVDANAERWRPAVDEVGTEAQKEAPRGVGVELKGLSVTLHWRANPAAEHWAVPFAERTALESGLICQHGRMSIELRPPVGSDKGTVVYEIGLRFDVACYFGDDLGDLPAFEALGRLAARGVRVARVAVVDAQAAPEVAAAADVVVEGPAGAVELLERLAARTG